jgi:hypothetical protein
MGGGFQLIYRRLFFLYDITISGQQLGNGPVAPITTSFEKRLK